MITIREQYTLLRHILVSYQIIRTVLLGTASISMLQTTVLITAYYAYALQHDSPKKLTGIEIIATLFAVYDIYTFITTLYEYICTKTKVTQLRKRKWKKKNQQFTTK